MAPKIKFYFVLDCKNAVLVLLIPRKIMFQMMMYYQLHHLPPAFCFATKNQKNYTKPKTIQSLVNEIMYPGDLIST